MSQKTILGLVLWTRQIGAIGPMYNITQIGDQAQGERLHRRRTWRQRVQPDSFTASCPDVVHSPKPVQMPSSTSIPIVRKALKSGKTPIIYSLGNFFFLQAGSRNIASRTTSDYRIFSRIKHDCKGCAPLEIIPTTPQSICPWVKPLEGKQKQDSCLPARNLTF